jgi:hypothetical protein
MLVAGYLMLDQEFIQSSRSQYLVSSLDPAIDKVRGGC